jgi:hypothetical protein
MSKLLLSFGLCTLKFLNHPRQDQKLPNPEDLKDSENPKDQKDLEETEIKELPLEKEFPTEEEALQQALQRNALKEKHVYTIDTLIPYEEYALEKTDTVNVGPLTKEQGRLFKNLLEEFADLFAKDITELGRTDKVKHRIYTEDVPPVKLRPYNMPPDEQNFIKEEIE